MHKIDRRVLRTRQALRAALLELMDEKEYSSITVEEITERANLGRSTFYLHYQDKEELLLEEFAGLIHQLTRQIASISILEWQQQRHPQRPVLLLFQHVAANEKIYRLILGGERSLQAIERLHKIFVQAANELAQIEGEVRDLLNNSKVSITFLAYYFSGALLATIGWWLEQDPPYPAEDIARQFQQMFMPGLKRVLGGAPLGNTPG